MLIKCDPKPVASFSVKIGNNQIAHTNCTKYLGVIADDKLSWYCWVRLGSSTWNVLWLWNTNKERFQKQVHKAAWKLIDNIIKEQRQKERIRMHTVILSSDLNPRRTKTDTGFANTWFTRTLYCVFIWTIVFLHSVCNSKSPLGRE